MHGWIDFFLVLPEEGVDRIGIERWAGQTAASTCTQWYRVCLTADGPCVPKEELYTCVPMLTRMERKRLWRERATATSQF